AGCWTELFVPSLGGNAVLPRPQAIFASAPASAHDFAADGVGSKNRRPLETVSRAAKIRLVGPRSSKRRRSQGHQFCQFHGLVALRALTPASRPRASASCAGMAKAILMDVEDDATNLVRPKKFVPPSEWAKLALYNLAMDWVIDQALVRMKLESKWPFPKT